MTEVYMNIPQDMMYYGGRVEWGTAQPGIAFYDLAGCTVRIGVNAVCECVFYGVGNLPVSNLAVVCVRADGKGEIQHTDASGRVHFMFGTGSAFTPSEGTPPPLKVFAADSATKDDDTKIVSWGTRISDAVLVGDTNGLHTEWSIPFTLHVPVVVVPPKPDPGVPTITSDEELRAYCMAQGYAASIDYLPDAALTRWARGKGWGAPVRSEFRYLNGAGVRMAGQAFTGGIAVCVEGAWDVISGVPW